jgi:SdpI/YhfL family protein
MLSYGYLLMTSDLVLILCGATMCWFSPRLRRHWVLGYGSPRSMINDATWQAGNRFAGMALGALALLAMLVHVSLWQAIESSDLGQTVSAASTLSLPFLVMFLTEKYLARRFRT